MAKVVITIEDGDNGLMVKMVSDEPLPKEEEHGTVAQELGLLGLELIRQEFKQASGFDLQDLSIH